MGSDLKCVFDRRALPTNERMSTKEALNHERVKIAGRMPTAGINK